LDLQLGTELGSITDNTSILNERLGLVCGGVVTVHDEMGLNWALGLWGRKSVARE
jgi:hypothetical protein